jgi:hypothetical protein
MTALELSSARQQQKNLSTYREGLMFLGDGFGWFILMSKKYPAQTPMSHAG